MPACHAGDRRFESGRVRHLRIYLRPVRPPGRGVPLSWARSPASSVTLRRVTRRPVPIAAGLVLVALVAVLAGSQLGLVGGARDTDADARRSRPASRPPDRRRRRRRPTPRPPAARRPTRPTDRSPGDPGPTRRDRRRADRPGHQLPLDPDRGHGQGCAPRSWPGRARRTTRSRSSRAKPRPSSTPSASPTPIPPTSSCSTTSRRSPRTSPRTASASRSCAPTPSGRRSAP